MQTNGTNSVPRSRKSCSQTDSTLTRAFRAKFKLGSETINNDAFASICFDGAGLLKLVGSPSYSMEFHDYKSFKKKMVARRHQDDPQPGTELVANVVLPEELKQAEPSLFKIEHQQGRECLAPTRFAKISFVMSSWSAF